MAPPYTSREQIQGLVHQYASACRVPYHLALAVLETESDYFPFAESEKGAKGLMQLMPLLLKHYGVDDPFDPDQNIKAGIQHMGVLLDTYGGDQERAVAAYFAGEPAVNRAQTLDELGPKTQAYVPRVLGRMAQLQETSPTAGGVPSDLGGASTEDLRALLGSGDITEEQAREAARRSTQWIYPTVELAGDAMVDDDGQIMDDGDPRREGILISYPSSKGHDWHGQWTAGPSPQEIHQIFMEVDPQGVVTREDAATVAAMGTSLAPTVGRAARRAVTRDAAKRAALKLGTKAVPGIGWGITGATAVAGAGGDLYRQFQIPDEVSGYTIESWPRKNIIGIEYEGAPKTAQDAAHSAMIAGLVEGLGEAAGGALANVAGRLGRWWKGTGFNRPALIEATQRFPEVPDVLARTGTNPTQASFDAATKAQGALDETAPQVVEQYGGTINAMPVIEEAMKGLSGPEHDINRLMVQRALGLELPGQAEGVSKAMRKEFIDKTIVPPVALATVGKYSRVSDLGKVRKYGGKTITTDHGLSLRVADKLRKAANVAARPVFTGGSQSGASAQAKVQQAVARALKKHIGQAMSARDRAKWEQLLRQSHQWNVAGGLAALSSKSGMPGVLQGGLAFGAAPAVTGLGYGVGGPLGAAAGLTTGLGLSQLSPLGRSMLGQTIVDYGATRLPQNVGRAGAMDRNRGALDVQPRPWFNMGPMPGQDIWDAVSDYRDAGPSPSIENGHLPEGTPKSPPSGLSHILRRFVGPQTQ